MIEKKSKLKFKKEFAKKLIKRKKENTINNWKYFLYSISKSFLYFLFLLPLFFLGLIIFDNFSNIDIFGNLTKLDVNEIYNIESQSSNLTTNIINLYFYLALMFIFCIPIQVVYLKKEASHFFRFLMLYILFSPIITFIIMAVIYIIGGIILLIPILFFGFDVNSNAIMYFIWNLQLVILAISLIVWVLNVFKEYNEEIRKVNFFTVLTSVGYYVIIILFPLSPYVNKLNYELIEYQQQKKILEQKKLEDARRFAIIQGTSNIRSGPSKNNKVVDRGKKVEKIEVFSKSGNWYYIEHNGKKGYIYKTLIKIVKKK